MLPLFIIIRLRWHPSGAYNSINDQTLPIPRQLNNNVDHPIVHSCVDRSAATNCSPNSGTQIHKQPSNFHATFVPLVRSSCCRYHGRRQMELRVTSSDIAQRARTVGHNKLWLSTERKHCRPAFRYVACRYRSAHSQNAHTVTEEAHRIVVRTIHIAQNDHNFDNTVSQRLEMPVAFAECQVFIAPRSVSANSAYRMDEYKVWAMLLVNQIYALIRTNSRHISVNVVPSHALIRRSVFQRDSAPFCAPPTIRIESGTHSTRFNANASRHETI